jgi:hypothetical protein
VAQVARLGRDAGGGPAAASVRDRAGRSESATRCPPRSLW